MNPSSSDPLNRVRRIVQQRLEGLQRAGVGQLPRADQATSFAPPVSATEPDEPAREHAKAPSDPRPVRDVSLSAPPPSPSPRPPQEIVAMPRKKSANAASKDRRRALSLLEAEVAACTRCRLLARMRTQTVFGVGDPYARLVFFGEAPGADEDRLGEPFVGKAGQLLTDIIEKGMKLKRSDVYIMNVLKCRPPENRNPLPDEVENCRPFFERQLEILQPEFICCLGAVAAQNLLETKVSVGKLRKQFHDYQGSKVLVTYHPSYLLRNPPAKKDTWEDIQLLLRAMGLPIPKKE